MKFEIFKVGKHTSSSGVSKDYSLEDLNSIINNHSDPTPIVVGHPKTNSPAFGWVKNLFMQGESLFAEAIDLVPEFLDLIKQKVYKNRSISLSELEDGTFILNHIGFLGGAMPAVKGLADIAFEKDKKEIFHEFALSLEEEVVEKEVIENKEKVIKNKEKVIEISEFNKLKTTVVELTNFIAKLKTPEAKEFNDDMQSKIDDLNVKLDAAYFQRSIVDKMDFSSITPAIRTKLETLLGYFKDLDFSKEENNNILPDFQELVNLIEPFQTKEILKKVDFHSKEESKEFNDMNVDEESMKLYNEVSQYAKENDLSFAKSLNILINQTNEVE